MGHERDEALALLGAFRAAALKLCEDWEARDNDWRQGSVDEHDPAVEQGMDIADMTCARELRALLSQTPMDLRGLLQLPAPDLDDRMTKLTLKTLHDEIDALKARLRESRLDTKVGYRLYEAAEARILELRGELAEVLAECERLRAELVEAKQQTYSSRADIAEVRLRACQAQLTELREQEAYTGKIADRCAELSAERDAFQSMCTQAQRELARARALIEAVAVRCEVAAASFAAAETLPDNDATPTARALRMVVEQIGTLLRAALNA